MSDSNQNPELSSELSSDLSSDEDFATTDEYIKDKQKIYQIQYVKDDLYIIKWVGYSDTLPTVTLTNFTHEDNSCFIESNFSHINESHLSGTCLFDLITMNVIQKDGRELSEDNSEHNSEHKNVSLTHSFGIEYKIILSVEISNVKLDKENKGNLMIWFEKSGKRCPLKTNLTHPGNEKIQYYIVAELKNEKIKNLLIL